MECSVRSCKREVVEGQKRCQYHRESAARYYRRKRERMTAEDLAAYNARANERMRDERQRRRRQENARRQQETRREVVEHYGGKCACCGEDQYEFLTLHHKNGDGEAHRRELFGNANVGGSPFAWKIRKMGFPDVGLEVLCYNCHLAIHRYGSCPHQR